MEFKQEKGDWTADDAQLANTLKRCARTWGFFADDIFTILPRHEMTVRILALPSHDPLEIAGMVRLSAEEHVPYASHDLVIDQCIVQRLSDGHARVLAVFAHKDLVERHVHLLAQAGLDPKEILVSTGCLASALFSAQGDTEERHALVNLALGGMEIIVRKGNVLEYGRAAAMPFDWTRFGDSPDMREELVNEIRASLGVFKREFPDEIPIDRIYVSAETGDPVEVARSLSEALEKDISPARQALTLCVSETLDTAQLPLTLLGGALTAQDRAQIKINLIPPSLIFARKRADIRRLTLRVVAAGLLLTLSLGVWFGLLVYQRQRYILNLTQRIEEFQPVAKEVEAKQRNLFSLQQKVDRSGNVLEVLSRITELAPEEGLNFTKMTYDSRKGVVVQGRAVDLAVVNRFSNTLRRSAQPEETWLTEARQGKSAEVMERGVTVQQYEIEIPFPEKSRENDASSAEPFTP